MNIDWAALLSLVAIALVTVQLHLQKRALQQQLTSQNSEIDALKSELRALSSASMGMGNRLVGQEKRWFDLENRIEEMAKNDPARVSYSEASRLVELGAGVEDLMNSCGISRPEAELVTALSLKQQQKIPVIN